MPQPEPTVDRRDRPAQAKGRRRGYLEQPEEDREVLTRKPKRSRLPGFLLFILILAVIGGVGAFGWSQREKVMGLIASFEGTSNPKPVAAAPASDASGAPTKDADRLPGTLSGGQVQRVCIARALAPQPRLIVLDEAVSNLDLVLQIQILDLLAGLQDRLGTAFLFITHDVRLVRRFCDRVTVLHDGGVVEDRPVGPALSFGHPAAQALLDATLPASPRPR